MSEKGPGYYNKYACYSNFSKGVNFSFIFCACVSDIKNFKMVFFIMEFDIQVGIPSLSYYLYIKQNITDFLTSILEPPKKEVTSRTVIFLFRAKKKEGFVVTSLAFC